MSAEIQARIHNIFLGGLVPGTYLMSLSNAGVRSREGMGFLLLLGGKNRVPLYILRYGIYLIPTTGQKKRISICNRHISLFVCV